MKVTGLLSPGCQVHNRNVLDSSADRLVYCSTLSTVTHVLEDYRMEGLQTAHKKSLTSVCWSRLDPNIYLTSGADCKLHVWDVNKENPMRSFGIKAKPVSIEWIGKEPNSVLILQKPGIVYQWNFDGENDTYEVLSDKLPSLGLTCIRSDIPPHPVPLDPKIEEEGEGEVPLVEVSKIDEEYTPRVACGYYTGIIYIYNTSTKTVSEIAPPADFEGIPVTDIQWNPLDKDIMVATYENGDIACIDVTQLSVKHVFSHQQTKATQTAFIPYTAGTFVSATRSNCVLTLWNTSQVDFMEQIQIHHKTCGINAIKLCNDGENNKILVSFLDGDIGIFAVPQQQMFFKTEPGHSDTVYSCKLDPFDSNILATSSYDGFLKIWNLSSKKCEKQINCVSGGDNADLDKPGLGILYCLSWCVGDINEKKLVVGSSTGEIIYVNVEKGIQTSRAKLHANAIVGVSWNAVDTSLVASVSLDKMCIISSPTGKIVKKYEHPDAVYGCEFSRHQPNILATCCHDGVVRIYDTSDPSVMPVATLKGHKARVFCVAWSTLLPNVFATGSDDNTVRVWEYGANGPKLLYSLEGHTNCVRTILWNSEVPWLLLSGSWDCTIRIWDIRSPYEKCKEVVFDHHGDIYGLTSHPERPFVVISASRDTSLRLWELQSMFNKLQMQIILADALIDDENLMDVQLNMVPETAVHFCGNQSKLVQKKNLDGQDNKLASYAALFDYFSCVPGVTELWALAKSLKFEEESKPVNDFVNINDLRAYIKKKTIELENEPPAANLEEAAYVYLQLGDVKKYCEIMIQLGRWETAIAMAPARSMGYWKELCTIYSTHLKNNHQPNAITFLLATGDTQDSINYAADVLKDLDGALLIASGESVDALPGVVDEVDTPTPARPVEGEREDVFPSEKIRAVVQDLALIARNDGMPVKAACYWLAIGDVAKTIQLLVLGDEIPLALAISRIFEEEADYVNVAMARKFELEGLYHESLHCIQQMADATIESQLVAARFIGSSHYRADFYLKAGLNTQEEYVAEAEQQLSEGLIPQAVTSLVLARDGTQAYEYGTDHLMKELSKPTFDYKELKVLPFRIRWIK